MYNCYLTCPRGLEHLAQDEISNYADSITVSNGGINFQVDKKGLYQINLSSRTGTVSYTHLTLPTIYSV